MLRLATIILELFLPDEPLVLPLPGTRIGMNPRGEVSDQARRTFNGYYNGYEVNFGRRLDPATIEQAKALQVFATNNWMPLHESWRLSGLTDNPQEWEDELLLQSVDRLPWVIELAALAMVKSYYGVESPQFMRLIEKIEQQGSGGGSGAPPGGAPGLPSPGGLQPTNPNATPNGNSLGGGESANLAMQHHQPGGRPIGGNTPPGATGGAPPGMTQGRPGG
jgi:hypothetical protein